MFGVILFIVFILFILALVFMAARKIVEKISYCPDESETIEQIANESYFSDYGYCILECENLEDENN